MRRALTMMTGLLLAVGSLAAQGGGPPRSHAEKEAFGITGCPLRSVKATVEKIGPNGGLVLRTKKNDVMAALVTGETLLRIPGYSQDDLDRGQLIRLSVGTPAKLQICERDGTVYELKLLEKPKSRPE